MAILSCKNVTTDHAKPLKILFYWLLNREEKWATYMGESFLPLSQTCSKQFFWLPKQGKGGEAEISVEKRKQKWDLGKLEDS